MQKKCVLVLTHRCNLNCVYCYQKHKTSKDMALETAINIVSAEVQKVRESQNKDGIRFDLFGGEPFLRFDVIKKLCNWIWETINDVKIEIVVTTNGTLLDDNIKQWLKLHKKKIHLVMSVDGKDDTQKCNRGCHTSELPINFALESLTNYFLNMTVSHLTLQNFADELIYFHEQGYHVEAKLAQEENWQIGDGKIYEAQLNKIANYYLEHQEICPIHLFNEKRFIHLLNNEPNEKYAITCGIGVGIIAYNVDGKLYPCHHFLPNVNGDENILEYLNKIDFSDSSQFIDNKCIKCDILKLCRTCCANNYTERGDMRLRDHRTCQIMLAEAKVISSYQIRKYMPNQLNLTPKELLILKAAVKCYQLCCDFEKKSIYKIL